MASKANYGLSRSAARTKGEREDLRMPYWQLFYHIVWTTKRRLPLLSPEIEPLIYGYLRGKAIGLGATVFALNGMSDHVHMVAAIPPRIAVSHFVGQVKAVASTKFNRSGQGDGSFFWQEEYGVFSCDAKRLPNFIGYVERQKEHHCQNTLIPILERSDNMTARLAHEAPLAFAAEETQWRRELESLGDLFPPDHSM